MYQVLLWITHFDQLCRYIQNSLRGMRGALDWLSTQGKLNSKQKEQLENIYKQQHNLAVLVTGLIETFRYMI